MAKLQLNVVTAEGESFSGEVDMVVAPGEVGEFTVLPSHARLISTLTAGELRFDQAGVSTSLALTGGFLEVAGNRVTVDKMSTVTCSCGQLSDGAVLTRRRRFEPTPLSEH